MFEKLCIGLLTLSALALAGNSIFRGSAPPVPLQSTVGDSARSFEVMGSDGTAHPVSSSDPALIVFFSTACEWCMKSLPTYREVATQDCSLDVILAVIDVEGEALRAWEEENLDTLAPCGSLTVGSVSRPFKYDVPATPTHYLIRGGAIVEKQVGAMLRVPGWL